MDDGDLFAISEAARRTSLTESYLRRLARDGSIPGAIKDGRSWMIPVTWVDEQQRRRNPPVPEETWQLERSLLYRELDAARTDALIADRDRLAEELSVTRDENQRLRRALNALLSEQIDSSA